MSNIEEKIRENRSIFFEDEPPQGHVERFQKRIGDGNNYLWPLVKVAAGILLIFSIGLTFYLRDVANEVSLSQISSELAETEQYYKRLFNKKISVVEQMLNARQFAAVKQELRVLDKNYEQVKEDFKLNPDDQRIIHAMIHYHQIKIELLQQVVDQVKQNKSFKNQGYDTEQV